MIFVGGNAAAFAERFMLSRTENRLLSFVMLAVGVSALAVAMATSLLRNGLIDAVLGITLILLAAFNLYRTRRRRRRNAGPP
jgi:hypothetical protein